MSPHTGELVGSQIGSSSLHAAEVGGSNIQVASAAGRLNFVAIASIDIIE